MREFNLQSFAAHAIALIAVIDKVKRPALEEAAGIIETEAKAVLGTNGYNWPALSPNTKKTQPGMLLETGEMRDSISHTVISDSEAQIGSNLDRAKFHELGTSRMPPRPFLMGAAVAKGQEVADVIGSHIIKAIK